MLDQNERRNAILLAALTLFLDPGYEATGIADIRRESGASTGSIYHHFGSKEGVAVALYKAGIRSASEAMLEALAAAGSAEAVVKGGIRALITWADANPELFRFLATMRRLAPVAAAQEEIREIGRVYQERAGALVMRFITDGSLRPLPPDLYPPAMLGMAQDYLIQRMEGTVTTDSTTTVAVLGDLAWRALRS